MDTSETFHELRFRLYGKYVHYQLSPEELVRQTLERGEGNLSGTGALCVDTGNFTGRSPKDKFTVIDDTTSETVDWGEVNRPISKAHFDILYKKMRTYLAEREVWIRDAHACADPRFSLTIRIVNETPWANLFCYNLFLRPEASNVLTPDTEWLILQAPGFFADPQTDGTRQKNFTIVNFSRKIILIGGTAYTGEMKKGIFSVLNYLLPLNRNVLSMHCSANEGKEGDVALFFGLSGTGKTTLSADVHRSLIGDDEHGWSDDGVFNFEGGCYAKAVDLDPVKEPEIFGAIKAGALLENVVTDADGNVDFSDTSKTENTRVAYPIQFIKNAKEPSFGGKPRNIFFLTCDAFGILPPISKLDKGQAMYHFISGYTAKVAGTEMGVSEPQSTFSACFGRVFLPLHPLRYAELLGQKLDADPTIKVWLVNTGWIGGAYGKGNRISLKYTRALIASAMAGELDNAMFVNHPVFKFAVPQVCKGVPVEILNPRELWEDAQLYDQKAAELAGRLDQPDSNTYGQASETIRNAAPVMLD
jgi:phosphoenolpyruvate carboxykinase (ATP)